MVTVSWNLKDGLEYIATEYQTNGKYVDLAGVEHATPLALYNLFNKMATMLKGSKGCPITGHKIKSGYSSEFQSQIDLKHIQRDGIIPTVEITKRRGFSIVTFTFKKE
jgi:hypothetical protein